MTATRSRKEELNYKKFRNELPKDSDCQFCNVPDNQVIEAHDYFLVLKNIFPYSIWDGQTVDEHLMIVPRKHIDSLGNLPKKSAVELVGILSKYEKIGFNIYARAPSSSIKSVVHQHTHLIKTSRTIKRFVIFIKKPYIRLVK